MRAGKEQTCLDRRRRQEYDFHLPLGDDGMETYDVVMYLLGTVCFGALGIFTFLAATGSSELVLLPFRTGKFSEVPVAYWVTFGLAVLGAIAVFYTGIHKILDWIPYTWGGRDEDGGFEATRDTVTVFFTGLGVFGFFKIATNRVSDSVGLRASRIRIKYLNLIIDAGDNEIVLAQEANKLEKFLDEIQANRRPSDEQYRRADYDPDPFGILRDAYTQSLWDMRERRKVLSKQPRKAAH